MGRALRLLGDASARCWSYTRVSIHAAISRTPYHASERKETSGAKRCCNLQRAVRDTKCLWRRARLLLLVKRTASAHSRAA